MDSVPDDRRPAATLPPEVAAEVGRRRAGLLARARGRILDLDEPEGRRHLAAAMAASEAPVAVADRFDTIICTAALIHEPDLPRALGALAARLADGGELLVVEPVYLPGPIGLVTASAGTLLQAVAGLHLSRDVVAAIRATGLTVADVDRFDVATGVWPLRHFVEAHAVRVAREVAIAGTAAGDGP